MWWVLWALAALLALFCTLDVWYFLRAAAVVLRAWFQPPVWDVTAEQIILGRVLPHDIDMCHMNNARYLRECDFARFSLYVRNGVFKALRALGASMVVGATTIRYRRALCIGEGFELRSRIVTWDDKSFFLEQRFVSAKDGLVCAVMYCKQNVIRGSPDKIMQHLCKRKVRREPRCSSGQEEGQLGPSKMKHTCKLNSKRGEEISSDDRVMISLWFVSCRWSVLSFQRTFSIG